MPLSNKEYRAYQEATWFSKLFYLWLNPLFTASHKVSLTIDDIYRLSENTESDYVTKELGKQWSLEATKRKPNLFFAILKTCKVGAILTGTTTMAEMTLYTIRPLILQQILLSFQTFSNPESRISAVLYCSLLLLLTLMTLFLRNASFWMTYTLGLKLRVASSGLVYKKILRLNQKALISTNAGHIINMLATDAQRFELTFMFLHYLWVGPIQTVLVLILMMQITLLPSICAIAIMLFFIPVQTGLNRLYSSLRFKIARITDTRLRLLSDIINGIKIIKLHAWENLFANFVHQVRRAEMRLFLHVRMCQAFQYTQLVYQVKVTTLALLVGIVLMHRGEGDPEALRSDQLFALLNYLGSLFISVTLFMPMSVQNIFDTLVSCSRISKFLLLPEKESANQPRIINDEVPRLQFTNASASWTDTCPTLRDISLHVSGPRLVAIIGGVGSGKSSLLQAALGELPLTEGSLERTRNVSYMPQVSWIFPGTIRENVLCSLPMESDRYSAVLEATTLDVDIARLPRGDKTQVGERGVSLSGGQKARICLARIAYARSQLVLLDDPLAAVDARVVNHLFHECICGFLSDRLRILVTHQHHLLSKVDLVVGLQEGRIVHIGTYSQLLAKGINPEDLVQRKTSTDLSLPTDFEKLAVVRPLPPIQAAASDLDLPVVEAVDSGCDNPTLVCDEEGLPGHRTTESPNLLAPTDSRDASNWWLSLPDILDDAVSRAGRQRANSSSDVYHSKDLLSLRSRLHQHFLSHRNVKNVHHESWCHDSNASIGPASSSSRLNTPRGSLTTGLAYSLENAGFAALQGQATTTDIDSDAESYDLKVSGQMDRLPEEEEEDEDNDVANRLRHRQANRVKMPPRRSSSSKEGKKAPVDDEKGGADGQMEGCQTGAVKWKHYLILGRIGGGLFGTFMTLLLFVITITNYAGCDVWLTKWSEIVDNKVKLNGSEGNETLHLLWDVNDNRINLLFYGCLTLSLVLLSSTRSLVFFMVLINSARRLHHRMLLACLFTRLRFFETSTSGRILNRFAKDIGQVDDILPSTIHDFLQCFVLVVATGLVTVLSNYWTAISIVPLLILFYIIRRYYLRTARDLKRIESVARSPIFSWVNITIQGLPCIRASQSTQLQLDTYNQVTDKHSSIFFVIIGSARWLGMRLDLLCVAYITCVVATCLLMAAFSSIPSANVGLMITYASSLVSLFQWCIRQSAEMENQMVSIERAVEYVDLQPESTDPPIVDPLPYDWPEHGHIVFNNLWLRYHAGAPWALHNVSLDIKSGLKVGVVGRTGAGKSSLISALFRLVEAESGSIVIDGIDIARVELADLRNRMSIIPQDPILFSGTIRSNLDPDDIISGEAIWKALASVRMNKLIASLAGGLDAKICEGGSNFSTGERQLLSLVRAILGERKILVVDEATANVDPGTDAVIQRTLRSQFSTCTVITIAHRLHTVIDNDMLVVMEGGRIVEAASPHALLNPELAELDSQELGGEHRWKTIEEGGTMDHWITGNGALASLVRQTGALESYKLATIARQTFIKSLGRVSPNETTD